MKNKEDIKRGMQLRSYKDLAEHYEIVEVKKDVLVCKACSDGCAVKYGTNRDLYIKEVLDDWNDNDVPLYLETKEDALRFVLEHCDENERSTEYMLEMMQSYANINLDEALFYLDIKRLPKGSNFSELEFKDWMSNEQGSISEIYTYKNDSHILIMDNSEEFICDLSKVRGMRNLRLADNTDVIERRYKGCDDYLWNFFLSLINQD